MPIVKTFEENAYNSKRFVKALKFYDYRGDCSLINQIIVDEGILDHEFRTYDSSILMFGNSIIFYKREDNWHKLCQYDVVSNELKEIEGYSIKEPINEDIRYHIIFSQKFGEKKTINQDELHY